jgi:hypothetical protein
MLNEKGVEHGESGRACQRVTIPLRIERITRLEFRIGRTTREWDKEEQRRG